jgi:hypothetical protein
MRFLQAFLEEAKIRNTTPQGVPKLPKPISGTFGTSVRVVSHDPDTPKSADPTEGRIIAVLIDSPILGPVWFAFDDVFKSGDHIPVFFARELPFLQKMSPEELRRRYEYKCALGGGWIRDRKEN